ncbi:MAG: hypothetical protein U0M54_09650 [Bacteroidales bacterium]
MACLLIWYKRNTDTGSNRTAAPVLAERSQPATTTSTIISITTGSTMSGGSR